MKTGVCSKQSLVAITYLANWTEDAHSSRASGEALAGLLWTQSVNVLERGFGSKADMLSGVCRTSSAIDDSMIACLHQGLGKPAAPLQARGMADPPQLKWLERCELALRRTDMPRKRYSLRRSSRSYGKWICWSRKGRAWRRPFARSA